MDKQTQRVVSSKDTKAYRRYDIGDPADKTKIFGTLYIPLAEGSSNVVSMTLEDAK